MLYGFEIGERELGTFLSVSDEESGAFYCENNVFREIVKLQLCELRRSHGQAQILLVRLNRDDLSPERRSVFMKQLEHTLTAALRAGDPFTKLGSNRYVILLVDDLLDQELSMGQPASRKGSPDFELEILFRQNYSWQGRLRWPAGGKEATFRSVLELIFTMETVLAQSEVSAP